ncbi:MAG: acetyl-CoA carboxylase carboxyltransferase subunit alpha [Bacteriovoracia bacterium]
MEIFLEFEKPIATLEKKLEDLRELSKQEGMNLGHEISILEKKVVSLTEEIYSKLSPWERVQVSRHANRPYTLDYIEALFPSFMDLAGDRCFGEDRAIISGTAMWPPQGATNGNGLSTPPGKGTPVLVLGHQKGRTTKQKMERNFGMAKPEGYRKAIRLMQLADRMRMPIITFIDTPGAYPGIETEERGQAQAIAESILTMAGLSVPVLCVVIGEGGSGGALALGIGNKVLMMEYSTYSVISPEGCASILWSDSKYAEKASDCLKMSPTDLLKHGVIDGIVNEPSGGAHRNWPLAFEMMRKALHQHFDPMLKGFLAGIELPAPVTGATAKANGTGKKLRAKAKGLLKGKKPKKKAEATATNNVAKTLRLERIQKFRDMGGGALGQTRESTGS